MRGTCAQFGRCWCGASPPSSTGREVSGQTADGAFAGALWGRRSRFPRGFWTSGITESPQQFFPTFSSPRHLPPCKSMLFPVSNPFLLETPRADSALPINPRGKMLGTELPLAMTWVYGNRTTEKRICLLSYLFRFSFFIFQLFKLGLLLLNSGLLLRTGYFQLIPFIL